MRDIPALADREELETSSMNGRTPLHVIAAEPAAKNDIYSLGYTLDHEKERT